MSADVAPAGSAGSAGSAMATSTRRLANRTWSGRNRYLAAAACVAICAVMISPIVLSVLGFYLLGEALREALDPKLRR